MTGCQLLEALRREVPDVHIVGVELPGVGLCIRYAPLEIGDSQYQYSLSFISCGVYRKWLCKYSAMLLLLLFLELLRFIVVFHGSSEIPQAVSLRNVTDN